jgi:GNAT superfamily N-acetyltransferase
MNTARARTRTPKGEPSRAPRPSPKAAGPAAELTVRLALPVDEAPLQFFFDTALRRDYFLRRGQLAELIADARHTVMVAELDGVLVGAAILTRGARLVNMLVHPSYRGLGVGRRLIESSGAISVRAKLDMSTGDPRPFYRRAGFEGTGRFNDKGNIELLERAAPTGGAGEGQSQTTRNGD